MPGLLDEGYYDAMGNFYPGAAPAAPMPERAPIPQTSEIKGYEPKWNERLAAWMMGDERPSPEKYRFVTGLLGTSGTPGSERMSVGDMTPYGMAVAATNAKSDYNEGNYGSALINAAGAIPVPGAKAGSTAVKAAAKEAKAAAKAIRSTELPAIREMPLTEAITTARKEPHLIKSGDQSEGVYVGSPRDIQSKRGLTNQRKAFDEYVAADPRGGDWYDRYREAMNTSTGGDPNKNLWASNAHGQFSAGVDPGSELQFVLKENNATLMGQPIKAARPAQHEAGLLAAATNDPSKYQLGDKTGEYARLVNPNQSQPPGATGVNDFRHARNWGYTEAGGGDQRGALTDAQHRFLDYETALSVDRANKANLDGRSTWTGEQLQAAPWVRQKAFAMLDQRPALTQKRMAEAQRMVDAGVGSNSGKTVEQIARDLAYEDAFVLANKTIGDFYPKHTAHATHEAMIGPNTGHLPGSVNATEAERLAFSRDPASTWATAPMGRDAIYAGLQHGDTGISGRVMPTRPTQGIYQPPGGLLETNPGEVAQPLVAFTPGRGAVGPVGPQIPRPKTIADADRQMLQSGETLRAYVDAQDAGAAHKTFAGKPGESNSVLLPLNRPATKAELLAARDEAAKHGLNDVVDNGSGILATDFGGAPKMDTKGRRAAQEGLLGAVPGAPSAQGVSVDSVYAPLVDEWKQGVGSGAATRTLLKEMNVTPEARAAFDQNPYLAERALAKVARDDAQVAKWGATREDIQNARKIIGDGPGWIGRLEEGLKNGTLLPALGAAILSGAVLSAGPKGSPNADPSEAPHA